MILPWESRLSPTTNAWSWIAERQHSPSSEGLWLVLQPSVGLWMGPECRGEYSTLLRDRISWEAILLNRVGYKTWRGDGEMQLVCLQLSLQTETVLAPTVGSIVFETLRGRGKREAVHFGLAVGREELMSPLEELAVCGGRWLRSSETLGPLSDSGYKKRTLPTKDRKVRSTRKFVFIPPPLWSFPFQAQGRKQIPPLTFSEAGL